MLQTFFNPEWQITSKSFLLLSFLIDFSFSPAAEISRLELEFEESLPWKTASIFKEGIGQESNGVANQEKQIFLFARSRLRLRPQEIWERDYSRVRLLSGYFSSKSGRGRLRQEVATGSSPVQINYNTNKSQKCGECRHQY